MSRKDAIDSLFLKKPEPSAAPVADKAVARVRTGAISAMGSSLQEMAEGAKAAARLQQQLASGDAVVSLDPSKIDGSTIADRLPADIDPTFDQLVVSIAENGQQVPILVRPHPDTAGRYQIAYGRRRLRAAVKLGSEVRAIVQTLSDSELVVAQGRENLDRADLSFIEKALFARRLEDAGFDRATIVAALSTDKADLSRYISVARSIPESLAFKIGPASRAGRARWVALAEGLARPKAMQAIESAIETTEFRNADSDARFAQVFKLAVAAPSKPAKKLKAWSTPRGKKAATIEHGPRNTALIFDEKLVPTFGAFVAEQLDRLYEQFLETTDPGGANQK
ncbi:ParB family chromosome partitioning protein [Aminobacter lissarensis]|uniref:ParB family chromosome partitioning protein n=1 Tax=Aminobacter carboxidus TaxID=376165 RepID=A0A8E2BGJ8_9HYPH|nr:plasmid partitioning protein RepB [Aminobacter lissarensis]MBB6469480.1 ParB family chromosome partitioning protein [Aminobacter lissarensis]